VRLILASRSPRRADLLAAAGFRFEIAPVEVDEARRDGEAPDVYVSRVAEAKSAAVDIVDPAAAVVAADTVVVIDGRILGKPADAGDAADMLRRLSGRSHEVVTGVVVRVGERRLSRVERTRVTFLPLGEGDIAWYVSTGEPFGKAGAYAIQGLASRFVDRVEGSYTNVVGLPVAALCELLAGLGVPLR
jgi:septum formation protein